MLPISGPFVKQDRAPASGPATFWREQQRYRQKRPYNLPLKYSIQTRISNVTQMGFNSYDAAGSFNSNIAPFTLQDSVSGDPYLSSFLLIRDRARNVALKKFNDKRGEKAALGVALGEAHQSIGMVAQRGLQIASAIRACLRFRFGEVAEILGVTRHPKWHKLSRSGKLKSEANAAASNWLEFSFGWKPLCSDMYTALDVLKAPINYQSPVRVSGKFNDTVTIGAVGPGQQYAKHTCKARCTIGAVLTVENPNMDLANRLGLTNPFMVVYELIPWSFVLNWLVNVEEYLGQFNQYLGVTVTSPFFSDSFVDDVVVAHQHWSGNPNFAISGTSYGASMMRSIGSLPSVRLGIRPVGRLSVGRALNAISLLVQIGAKVK